MKVGTKSILFGAHCFLIHPWFVALGWWKLYGFPLDLRLWIAFFLHDIGYVGKPNMDGLEGMRHVELGARIINFLFGHEWMEFCLYHSRAYARYASKPVSPLCAADKMAYILTPYWLYIPMAKITGELKEYMGVGQYGDKWSERTLTRNDKLQEDQRLWYTKTRRNVLKWIVSKRRLETDFDRKLPKSRWRLAFLSGLFRWIQ